MFFSSPSRDRRVPGTVRKPAGFRPRLEVLEGRDLPSFAAPVTYAEPSPALAMVTADVNGDGRPDLITLSKSPGSNSITVRLASHQNKDRGQFGSPQWSYDGHWTDTALAVGDVNGDGKADLVLGHAPEPGAYFAGTYTGSISVLLGNGTGRFPPPGTYYLLKDSSDITALALADVNGDGGLDVVGAMGAGVFVALNPGGGAYDFRFCRTYSDPTAGATAGATSLQVAVGDVTGDG